MQQQVNQVCRVLADRGSIVRRARPDGRIGNFPAGVAADECPFEGRHHQPLRSSSAEGLTEDDVKRVLDVWLRSQGWEPRIAWGHHRGADIDARRGQERWIIEAKGSGSLQPMRVNYLQAVLGEILQRMDDPNARYSIALPDMRQYRDLWERLPRLAKSRTNITALFVSENGTVVRIEPKGK